MSELLFKTAKENAFEMFEKNIIKEQDIKEVEMMFLHYMEGFRNQLLKDKGLTLSPDTIEVIREELETSIDCAKIPIIDVEHLKNLQQAQQEFNAAYGGSQ